MVFNSFHFAVFFLVVYALYRSVPHRALNWLLLVASYYFYGSWDWRFLVLLLARYGERERAIRNRWNDESPPAVRNRSSPKSEVGDRVA